MTSNLLRRRAGAGKSAALALLAATSALAAASPASAAPIVYAGAQQIGTTLATYSITTDGTIGDLFYKNVTAFDVTLSDGLSTVRFGSSATLGNGTGSGKLIAGATALSMYPSNSALVLNSTAKGPSGSPLGQLSFYGSTSYAVFGDAAHGGFAVQQGTLPNTVAFATLAATPPGGGDVAAVPEPAAWATMILGMGAVGLAMRRRNATTRIGYAG